MESTSSLTFGRCLKQRRKELDLTQQALANLVGCTVTMIRKVESDLRQPSRQLARRLAEHLQLPSEQQATFIELARQRGTQEVSATKSPLRAIQGTHNLPPQLSALIGRADDVDYVCDLLQQETVRLVTISGPPGVGKSRLALHAAAEMLPAFPDGVFVVPLESITPYPALLRAAIEQILGITPVDDESADETLLAYLRGRQLLLVLDTFDHLTSVAPSLTDLLVACPGLKLLVTSSTALRLSDEQVYPLATLPFPDPSQPLPPLAELARWPAVDLFVEQLSLAKRTFALTEANAQSVAAICARLDGLPLALKLAAARSTLLSPAQLLARLSDPLTLLTQGAIDAPERHQALRQALAWSYDLLEESEQQMLMRLAVFSGGCTLEAIEAVAVTCKESYAEIELIDTLTSLIRKSQLIQEEDEQGRVRFRMLETIQAYALKQLEQSGEANPTRDRHAQYYLGLAAAMLNAQPAAGQPDWLAYEQKNLDLATQWLNDSSCTINVPPSSNGTPQAEHHPNGASLARIISSARTREGLLRPFLGS